MVPPKGLARRAGPRRGNHRHGDRSAMAGGRGGRGARGRLSGSIRGKEGTRLMFIHGRPQRPPLRPLARATDARGADAHRLHGVAHPCRSGRRARPGARPDARGGELRVRLRGPQRSPRGDAGTGAHGTAREAVHRLRRSGRRGDGSRPLVFHGLRPILTLDGVVPGRPARVHAGAAEHRRPRPPRHRGGPRRRLRPVLCLESPPLPSG